MIQSENDPPVFKSIVIAQPPSCGFSQIEINLKPKSEKSISRPDKIPPPGQNLYAPGHENWYIFTHRNLDSISAARQWRNAIKHCLKILVKTSLTSCRKLARTLALERRDHFASLCTNHIEFSMLHVLRPPSLRAITNTAFPQTFSRLRSWKQP